MVPSRVLRLLTCAVLFSVSNIECVPLETTVRFGSEEVTTTLTVSADTVIIEAGTEDSSNSNAEVRSESTLDVTLNGSDSVPGIDSVVTPTTTNVTPTTEANSVDTTDLIVGQNVTVTTIENGETQVVTPIPTSFSVPIVSPDVTSPLEPSGVGFTQKVDNFKKKKALKKKKVATTNPAVLPVVIVSRTTKPPLSKNVPLSSSSVVETTPGDSRAEDHRQFHVQIFPSPEIPYPDEAPPFRPSTPYFEPPNGNAHPLAFTQGRPQPQLPHPGYGNHYNFLDKRISPRKNWKHYHGKKSGSPPKKNFFHDFLQPPSIDFQTGVSRLGIGKHGEYNLHNDHFISPTYLPPKVKAVKNYLLHKKKFDSVQSHYEDEDGYRNNRPNPNYPVPPSRPNLLSGGFRPNSFFSALPPPKEGSNPSRLGPVGDPNFYQRDSVAPTYAPPRNQQITDQPTFPQPPPQFFPPGNSQFINNNLDEFPQGQQQGRFFQQEPENGYNPYYFLPSPEDGAPYESEFANDPPLDTNDQNELDDYRARLGNRRPSLNNERSGEDSPQPRDNPQQRIDIEDVDVTGNGLGRSGLRTRTTHCVYTTDHGDKSRRRTWCIE